MSELSSARKFQFVAGNLALDFCNTVGGKRGVVAREYLSSFLDLAAWAQQARLLTTADAEQALQIAGRRPGESAAVLSRATELREALFRLFAARLSGKIAREPDLAILNAELSRSLGRLRLAAANHTGLRSSSAAASFERSGELQYSGACGLPRLLRPGRAHSVTAAIPREAFQWQWDIEDSALDLPLGPVACSAANLLTDPAALHRVRMCQGDTCGWLFLDASRNHSRCWWDMRDCGNRAKVRRHRQKHRGREQNA